MSYLLRMSAEIRAWLTDLRTSNPPAARLVGEALTALLGEGASLGPPMVISLADCPLPANLPEALDRSYQDRLERLQIARRSVAEAAVLARDIELQIADLEALQAELEDKRQRGPEEASPDRAGEASDELTAVQGQIAELRRRLPDVIEAGQKLAEKSQRLQARTDAFRTRKEVLRAAYTAARAECAIHEAIAALDQDPLNQDPGDQSARVVSADASIAAAADKLREVTGEIERELRPAPPATGPGYLRPQPGLMELRPGAPGDSEIRILFGIEPPGTALLIAVLEGRDAVRDQYNDAVLIASDILRQARAGQDPAAAAHAFDDAESFLDEFFPRDADEVQAGAAALVARNRARTLAEQRARRGLTEAQVAERMNVPQERVSAIERAEAGATEVRFLASYVEALGGRLEILADFAGERVVLR